jgi:ribosome-binding factor A
MKTQRQLQMGQWLKKNISEIFLRDDLLSMPKTLLTILEVDVSPDIKNAKIYIDIFGTNETKQIISQLNLAAAYFRHKLSSCITSRYVPELTFILDETAKKVSRIEALLAKEAQRVN